jgi:hypothetical protein
MSPEERQLLTSLFDRVKTASQTPRDREAETLVEQSVRDQPYSPYYLAQAVIVQEKGLEAASERIKQLEDQVRQLQDENARAAQAPAPQQSGGFLSSIFGSSQQPAPRPPAPAPAASGPWGNSAGNGGAAQQGYRQAPAYDGGYQGGPQGAPWSGGQPQQAAPSAGSSFLKGALGTAAGVAGGMLLANTLSSAFSSHTSALGLGSPFNETANPFGTPQAPAPVEETVINNYYGNDAAPNADNATDNVDFGRDDNAGWQQASDDSDWNNDSDWNSGDDDSLNV